MKKLLLILFVSMFLIQIVSAGLLDVIKEQPTLKQDIISRDIQISPSANKYPAVSIKTNWDLPLISKDIMDMVLTQHDEVCGIDCSSQGYTKLYEDGILFEGFDFYTILNTGKRVKQDIRSYQVYIKTNEEEYVEDIYEYKCSPTGKININGTAEQTCSNVKTGTITKTKPLWERYNIGEVVPAGEYEWKLEGQKKSSRTVDFIPIVQGDNKIEDWATWGGTTNTNSGLVLWIPFEDTDFKDKSIYGYNGSNIGSPDVTIVTGKVGNAGNFSGTSKLNLTGSAGSSKLNIVGNTFTMNFWAKPYSTTGMVYDRVGNAWETGYRLSCSSGNWIAEMSANGYKSLSLNGECGTNNWMMITLVYNGTDLSFYKNGTYMNKLGVTDNIGSSPIASIIGNSILSSIPFIGLIDEFGLWNRSLSSSEISYLYNNGVGITIAQGEVILNSPINNYISPSNSVNFNCSATVTGGATLTNMSLWTNSSGTWERNQTISNTLTGDYNTNVIIGDVTSYGGSITAKRGTKFIANKDTYVTVVYKDSQSDATKGYITSSDCTTVLASGNFVGNSVTLNQGIIAGNTYCVLVDNNGGNYHAYQDGTSLPINRTSMNYTYGWLAGTGEVPNQAYDVLAVDTDGVFLGTSSTQVFTTTLTQPTLWTCQACDSDGDCGFASENRTVSIDTAPPEFVFYSGTGPQNYGSLTTNHTITYMATDINLDSCWINYNGTNRTLPCVSGVLENYSFALQPNLFTATVYSNDTVGNSNDATFSWSYTLFENSKTYNTTTYETSTEPFSINVTGTVSSANLIYDGTSYAATSSGNVWRRSIDIPTITSPVNKTFYWSFLSGANIINSTPINQSVLHANFSICGGVGGTTKFLNFTFKDEATEVVLNASNDATSITYWLGSGSVTKSYNTLNTTLNYDYTFCGTPVDKTFYTDVSFKYSNPSYPLRTFTYDNAALTNATIFKTLYMLGSASGIYSAVRTADSAGGSIQGVVIQYERQISGLWVLLGQEITGSDGVATLWLDPNYQYRLTATKTGYTTVQVTIQPSQTTYTITMGTGASNASYASDIPGITYFAFPGSGSLNPQVNQQFNLTVMSTNFNLENCKLEIVNATNLSQALSSITGVTNSSYCFIQLYYTTTVDSNLFGRISVDTTESDGFVIIDSDYKWILIDLSNKKSWMTITSFFSELADIGEFGEGNEAEFSRYILFFLLLTIFIGVFTYFSSVELSSPGISLLILWIIIILASAGGFLSFDSGSSAIGAPFTVGYENVPTLMEQYGFAFIFTELIIAQALSIGRRTKD